MGKYIIKENILSDWEKVTNDLATEFVIKYFSAAESEFGEDYWWVAGEVGGVLFVNDYFFGFSRIVEAIRYEATAEQLFEYYKLEAKSHKENPMKVNFRNYVKGCDVGCDKE